MKHTQTVPFTIPPLTLSCSLSALLCEFVRRCEASVQNNTTGFQDCGPTRSLMPMWAISKHATTGFHHLHRSIHARWWWDEYQRIEAKEYRGVFGKGGEGDYNQGRVKKMRPMIGNRLNASSFDFWWTTQMSHLFNIWSLGALKSMQIIYRRFFIQFTLKGEVTWPSQSCYLSADLGGFLLIERRILSFRVWWQWCHHIKVQTVKVKL